MSEGKIPHPTDAHGDKPGASLVTQKNRSDGTT